MTLNIPFGALWVSDKKNHPTGGRTEQGTKLLKYSRDFNDINSIGDDVGTCATDYPFWDGDPRELYPDNASLPAFEKQLLYEPQKTAREKTKWT